MKKQNTRQSQSLKGMTQSQGQATANFSFSDYQTDNFFDEMFATETQVRDGYAPFQQRVEQMTREDLVGAAARGRTRADEHGHYVQCVLGRRRDGTDYAD